MNAHLICYQVCSRPIVNEFARITHKLDIMYCYPLIERSSSSTSISSLVSIAPQPFQPAPPPQQQPNGDHLTDRLDAFFPFDPMTLPISRRFIDGLYQEWIGDEDDSEGQSEDEEGQGDGEEQGAIVIEGSKSDDDMELISNSFDGVKI